MHFSQEAFKGSHLKFKEEQCSTLENISAGCSTGGESIFCQTDDFLSFDEFVEFQDHNPTKLKTITYFFPDAEQIDTRINDGATLLNSVENNVP